MSCGTLGAKALINFATPDDQSVFVFRPIYSILPPTIEILPRRFGFPERGVRQVKMDPSKIVSKIDLEDERVLIELFRAWAIAQQKSLG